PTDAQRKALGETAGELEVCSAFFMVVAACIAPQEPKLSDDYAKKGTTVGNLSFTLLKNLGVSEAAFDAQYKIYTDSMLNAMQKNCTNIAVLLQRYMNFCQRLSQDADPRPNRAAALVRVARLARLAIVGGLEGRGHQGLRAKSA